MILKTISLTIAACVAFLGFLSWQIPNDPLFYVISADYVANVLRLSLAAGMVYLSFRSRFSYRIFRSTTGGLAVILALVGLVGLLQSTNVSLIYESFKMLDYLLFLQAATVFGIATLTYGYRRSELPLRQVWNRQILSQAARSRRTSVTAQSS